MSQLRFFHDRLEGKDILNVFMTPDEELTRAQIAQRLGVSKSRGLISLIEELVSGGALVKREDVLINRAIVFVYRKV
jgi:hypothetical protein